VTFIRLPEQDGRRLWALVLQEISHIIPLPAAWRLQLTPREAEIVSYVLQNWYNESIAHHLHIALDTVKTHLKNIFQKLRVESRADLIYRAALLHQEARG
jgi:ATP/maltotriose-dependent transcriptional regulator MalT